MRPTQPGTWMTGTRQDEWRNRWQDQPVRLLVTCQCQGYEPWFEQRDVKVVQGGEPGV